MLRVHFTADDLANVRLARHPDPMWETLLSLYALRGRGGEILFDRWRHETRQRLRPGMRPLLSLVPAAGSAPDFLTPDNLAPDPAAGIEVLAHTPRARLRADLAQIQRERPLPVWTTDLAEGRRAAVLALTEAHQQYFDTCLARHWQRVRGHVERDLASCTRTLAHGGVETLLNTLLPGMRWNSPVLELDYPFDHEIHLGGRGLLLQPIFFDHGDTATTLIDESLAPVLAYPIRHQLDWSITDDSRTCDPLAAVLGRTRADILRAIVTAQCTTTELAKRTSTPLATASRHASILRDAGLITSHRHHNTVVHTATTLGMSLSHAGKTSMPTLIV